ncbi:hypothetical protein Acj9p011 [Acinetobacter phage Acj9]|uniref:Uncharacterized protein n=1 Tax=Acinetobacter phage Acj9 TaxID=760939 RepID=E5EPE5_9CAUD|nr:hypothetical protein Acj9p011 [Acinetobacter phage Acj9]ADG59911.1 hypothetical protein Acj9p011 [Acinetobacter phage Acj9]
MKVVIEVVATNMETGHVAISQKEVELHPNMPRHLAIKYTKSIRAELNKSEMTNKVGPILITRSFTLFP